MLGDGVANVRERFRDSGQVAPGLDVARVDVRGQKEGVAVPVRGKSCFFIYLGFSYSLCSIRTYRTIILDFYAI